MPLLKLEQLIDQFIQRLALQITVVARRLRCQFSALLEQVSKGIRIIAPALAQQISQQGIADDAFRERVTVGGFFPFCREIPVVGDVVIVEDHQAGQVREHSRDAAKALHEGIDAHLFLLITLQLFLLQLRWLWLDQRPGHRGPDQQVHGHDFAQGHQMVIRRAAGEDRLARTAEKTFAQGVVAFQRR